MLGTKLLSNLLRIMLPSVSAASATAQFNTAVNFVKNSWAIMKVLRTAGRRWVLRQTPPLWWSPIDFCRLRRAAATTMSDLSIIWCCPSMISAVFLCDGRHLLFPVIFGNVSYPQTWLSHDNLRRFTSGEDNDLLQYIFARFLLCVWYTKHAAVAFVSKGFDSSWPIASRKLNTGYSHGSAAGRQTYRLTGNDVTSYFHMAAYCDRPIVWYATRIYAGVSR